MEMVGFNEGFFLEACRIANLQNLLQNVNRCFEVGILLETMFNLADASPAVLCRDQNSGRVWQLGDHGLLVSGKVTEYSWHHKSAYTHLLSCGLEHCCASQTDT